MVQDKYEFANAPIEADSVLLRDPDLINVFRIIPGEKPIFFELRYKYAENGNDFWVIIENFGLFDRDLAGSKTPMAQRQFTAAEAESARYRIDEYFSGPEKKRLFSFQCGQSSFSWNQVCGRVDSYQEQ